MLVWLALLACGDPSIPIPMGPLVAPEPEVQSLLRSARRGDVEGVRSALQTGVDPDARDPVDLGTALIRATKFGELETVESLLAGGAAPDAGNRDGVTPLHEAAEAGTHAVLSTLLRAGAEVDRAESVQGHTPLHLASMAGEAESVRILLAAGADPNAKLLFLEPSPALEAAIKQSYLGVARLLLEAGADVEQVDAFGRSPLHQALQLAQDDDPELVRLLLRAGAKVDTRDDEGRSVLEAARDYLERERAGSVYRDRRERTLVVLESGR